jgi:hypothetical protein
MPYRFGIGSAFAAKVEAAFERDLDQSAPAPVGA